MNDIHHEMNRLFFFCFFAASFMPLTALKWRFTESGSIHTDLI